MPAILAFAATSPLGKISSQVRRAFGSKAALLKAVVEAAVAGALLADPLPGPGPGP